MNLHHMFIKTAKCYGKKPAIVDRGTDRRLTYHRTLVASLILQRRIQRMRDCYIGIMVPTSAGCMLSVLGTIMCGKVPVMINYSTGAEENCTYAREKCGFTAILTSRTLLEKIGCPKLPGMIFLEEIMPSISIAEKLAAAFRAALPQKMLLRTVYSGKESDTAVILFTSGSEKEPKAVQLTHRNIGSNIEGILNHLSLGPEDRFMSVLPLFHVFGHTTNFWLPLTVGMTAVTYANPLDYKKIPSIIREEKPTMITGTPSFFSGYIREAGPGDFASLRILVAGADKVPDRLREEFSSKQGKVLLEGYGTTETAPVISTNTLEYNKPGSIGKPLPNVKISIVDLETGKLLEPGQEGKILVKGDLVMKGYLNDLEETSLRIRDGWYDTGDIGCLDADGFLWHRGRLKRFVKIGGEMLSLTRIENELEQILPPGLECCAVELPDTLKGARIAVALTGQVDEKQVLRRLMQKLPAIAVPKLFVVFEHLPKMGSGKIDFRKTTRMVRDKIDGEKPSRRQ